MISHARQQLEALDLFADCSPSDLDRVASLLTGVDVRRGGVLMHEGDPGEELMILGSGSASVTRGGPDTDWSDEDGASVELGVVAGGSVVGELSLLHEAPRSATVTALVPLRVFVCNRGQFEALLQMPGVCERVAAIAARRQAANEMSGAFAVPVVLADGARLVLRPICPDDKDKLANGMQSLSAESRRRRFFTAKQALNPVSLAYLTELDFVDHFAWVAVAEDEPGQPIVGVARYIRLAGQPRESELADRPHESELADRPQEAGLADRPQEAELAYRPQEAELAMIVHDAYQGRGLGSLLLEALGVAARANGIERLVAHVLADNAPMCAMLRRAGGKFEIDEPGVVRTAIGVPTPDRLEQSGILAGLQAAAAGARGFPRPDPDGREATDDPAEYLG